jgi:hypothetical protein
MRKIATRVKNQLTSKLPAVQNLLRSQHGEGFVDTAIFPVEDVHDTN